MKKTLTGRALRELIKIHGCKIKDVAAYLEVTPQALHSKLSRKSVNYNKTLLPICDYLDIDPSDVENMVTFDSNDWVYYKRSLYVCGKEIMRLTTSAHRTRMESFFRVFNDFEPVNTRYNTLRSASNKKYINNKSNNKI